MDLILFSQVQKSSVPPGGETLNTAKSATEAVAASAASMTRRGSHCINNGHSSRTCTTRGAGAGAGAGHSSGVKLFGIRLLDGSMKKSSAWRTFWRTSTRRRRRRIRARRIFAIL
ncbi:hypothetical protein CRG98_029155 [Punica granatum]|uniref:Uncharacterized protein n=1 Tax=Punica granatum TaxID=22663 RepID=A0A2I0J2D9_PUNGR|nr:hypothetical protein CRG98_029155 [Punica granatum]